MKGPMWSGVAFLVGYTLLALGSDRLPGLLLFPIGIILWFIFVVLVLILGELRQR